ncbi:heme-binding domain-containing protein [Candidatus Nitrospira salsa]
MSLRATQLSSKEVDSPPHIQSTLKRACYDCYSHETVWPWYSQVAPARSKRIELFHLESVHWQVQKTRN